MSSTTQPSVLSKLFEAMFEGKVGLPRQEAKNLLDNYQREIKNTGWNIKPKEYATGRAILEAESSLQIQLLLRKQLYDDYRLHSLRNALLARKMPWSAEELEKLLHTVQSQNHYWGSWGNVLRHVQRYLDQGNALTPDMEKTLRLMRDGTKELYLGSHEIRQFHAQIRTLFGEKNTALPLQGETWADAALADIHLLPAEQQEGWKRLFAHALECEPSKPTAAWRKEAQDRINRIGEEVFRTHCIRWMGAATTPPVVEHQTTHGNYTYRTYENKGSDLNLSMLKGLAWMCVDIPKPEVAFALAKLIPACLKKIPGTGPWGGRAASAAVWSLTEMNIPEAIGQLGRLKTQVTFRVVLNQIEKGLEVAAARAGVTKADLEDMCVPTYGFEKDGHRRETFGECAALATITPLGEITLEWFGASGKAVKSVPTEVRKSHAAELKEFKTEIDAAGKTLTAQKIRFDSFYLPERVWKLQVWQERFAAHPILRPIALRLIWHFAEGEQKGQGIWQEETQGFVGADGSPLAWLTPETEVRLWHPIGFEVEAVLAWREYLQQQGIVQPFKQAYREVYLLTEAELRTATYSNRFAGHILKQHQMNMLAALRGWKNKLRLAVDDSCPPASKEFPEYNIRAEFWIETAGDEYNDSGTYLYLTTDQVRFYRRNARENYAHAGGGGYSMDRWGGQGEALPPIPLTEVPALLFSEVMRDVDMFVGVCSVGNDPTWQDGGPQGNYANYWSDYSFGNLSETAKTRRVVLERLVPRLKIASRCTLTEKFLVVRGDLRTYKIHLGSGNILMEPNDQYLCIVQDSRTSQQVPSVGFLPFEGDSRLALILSKAFLLANDTRITDETITRQIRR